MKVFYIDKLAQKTFLRDNHQIGIPPTRKELADELGVVPNAASEYIRALERKGKLTRIRGAARGIIING